MVHIMEQQDIAIINVLLEHLTVAIILLILEKYVMMDYIMGQQDIATINVQES